MKPDNQHNASADDVEALIQNHPLGRPLTAIAFFNNGECVQQLLGKLKHWSNIDVVFHDDGSTDGTSELLEKSGFQVLHSKINSGIGYTLKNIINYANQKKYQVLVVMAGNNKDDPNQMPRLLMPIYRDGYDYVQGSRRLQGGISQDIPLFRRLMVPVHALLMSYLTGFHCTDALNGFRAYKINMFFEDSRMNIWQDWLDHYELETYIHYNVLRCGYRAIEVPVTKSYTHFKNGMKLSHIRPFIDWWSILRPLFLLRLGLRK